MKLSTTLINKILKIVSICVLLPFLSYSQSHNKLERVYANAVSALNCDDMEGVLEYSNILKRKANRSGNLRMLARALNLNGIYYSSNGDFLRSEECYLESLRFCEEEVVECGFISNIQSNLGLLYLNENMIEDAIQYLHLSSENCDCARYPNDCNQNYFNYANALYLNGDLISAANVRIRGLNNISFQDPSLNFFSEHTELLKTFEKLDLLEEGYNEFVFLDSIYSEILKDSLIDDMNIDILSMLYVDCLLSYGRIVLNNNNYENGMNYLGKALEMSSMDSTNTVKAGILIDLAFYANRYGNFSQSLDFCYLFDKQIINKNDVNLLEKYSLEYDNHLAIGDTINSIHLINNAIEFFKLKNDTNSMKILLDKIICDFAYDIEGDYGSFWKEDKLLPLITMLLMEDFFDENYLCARMSLIKSKNQEQNLILHNFLTDKYNIESDKIREFVSFWDKHYVFDIFDSSVIAKSYLDSMKIITDATILDSLNLSTMDRLIYYEGLAYLNYELEKWNEYYKNANLGYTLAKNVRDTNYIISFIEKFYDYHKVKNNIDSLVFYNDLCESYENDDYSCEYISENRLHLAQGYRKIDRNEESKSRLFSILEDNESENLDKALVVQELCGQYFKKYQHDSIIILVNTYLSDVDISANGEYLNLYRYLSNAYMFTGEHQKAGEIQSYYFEADDGSYKLRTEIMLTDAALNVLNAIGGFHSKHIVGYKFNSDILKANRFYEQSDWDFNLKNYTTLKSEVYEFREYFEKALVYHFHLLTLENKNEEALKFYREYVSIYGIKKGSYYQFADGLQNLASYLRDKKRFEESLFFFEKAYENHHMYKKISKSALKFEMMKCHKALSNWSEISKFEHDEDYRFFLEHNPKYTGKQRYYWMTWKDYVARHVEALWTRVEANYQNGKYENSYEKAYSDIQSIIRALDNKDMSFFKNSNAGLFRPLIMLDEIWKSKEKELRKQIIATEREKFEKEKKEEARKEAIKEKANEEKRRKELEDKNTELEEKKAELEEKKAELEAARATLEKTNLDLKIAISDLEHAKMFSNGLNVVLFILLALLLLLVARIVKLNRRIREERNKIQWLNKDLKNINEKLSVKNDLINLQKREIFHRVYGNLISLTKIINLQKDEVCLEDSKNILDNTLQIVNNYAGIHKLLYESEERNSYDKILVFKTLKQLSSKVIKANFRRQVSVIPNLDEKMFLPSKKVLPIALAFYELLANSLKHGFKGVSNPTITYSIKDMGDGDFVFEYTDNGIGLPKEFYNGKEGHMGMRIINAQFKKDLNGVINISKKSGGGLRYVVNF